MKSLFFNPKKELIVLFFCEITMKILVVKSILYKGLGHGC